MIIEGIISGSIGPPGRLELALRLSHHRDLWIGKNHFERHTRVDAVGGIPGDPAAHPLPLLHCDMDNLRPTRDVSYRVDVRLGGCEMLIKNQLSVGSGNTCRLERETLGRR